MNTNLENEQIIFFDGICVFCNKSINLLEDLDKKNKFKFATLQGETAKQLLAISLVSGDLKSLVFYKQGKIFLKSSAVIEIVFQLGGFWKLIKITYIIPKIIRNIFYDLIAKNRYNWFGKNDFCKLPNESNKLKFLD